MNGENDNPAPCRPLAQVFNKEERVEDVHPFGGLKIYKKVLLIVDLSFWQIKIQVLVDIMWFEKFFQILHFFGFEHYITV